MKVVKPGWLVNSVAAGSLLPWQDYIYHAGARLGAIENTKIAQSSLSTSFVANPRLSRTTTTPVPGPSRLPRDHFENTLNEVNVDDDVVPCTPSPPPHHSDEEEDEPPLPAVEPASARNALYREYAAHDSNPHAVRAMANPDWRAAHTSAAPDFIEGFYKNSRLHHLSTWKAELQKLVAEAQEKASDERWDAGVISANAGVSMHGAQLSVSNNSSKNKGKGKARANDEEPERVIMHCDFDCFFVAAGLINRPQLRGKPVVVCHSQGTQGGASSTSEIASASYEARSFGVKNGMRSVSVLHMHGLCLIICQVYNRRGSYVQR
jgi:DNA repair protein REV1